MNQIRPPTTTRLGRREHTTWHFVLSHAIYIYIFFSQLNLWEGFTFPHPPSGPSRGPRCRQFSPKVLTFIFTALAVGYFALPTARRLLSNVYQLALSLALSAAEQEKQHSTKQTNALFNADLIMTPAEIRNPAQPPAGNSLTPSSSTTPVV